MAVEAFSIGKPVVAANHGGLVEIVSHDLNGFLFIPSSHDDLKRTLEELPSPSSDKYDSMSSNAVETYKNKFSEKSYQDKVSSLLIW
ncbi:D-inositol-3-phosphate glycosyltransferase [compost metagenome]